jgi:hypothetical protein
MTCRAFGLAAIAAMLLSGAAAPGLSGFAAAQTDPMRRGPARGTLLEAQAGDVACYLNIRDEAGRAEVWMAAFELCEQAEGKTGRRYAFHYEPGNVLHPDCQGNMECGRSLRAMLAVKMQPL